jgi:hypothetical protein
MSDIIDDTEVDFAHYVTATREIVEEFRDVLARHTAKLHQGSHRAWWIGRITTRGR